jgi:N-acetylneuraminic acid mutarotase
MAYIGENKTLFHGGLLVFDIYTEDNTDDETWIYNLSTNTWTQKYPDPKFSKRPHHGMAYIGDDKVVLFGGNISGISNDETWIDDLSANNWNQMSPSSKPSKRDHHGMAYLGGDKVLLFGGYNHQTLDIYGDT